ncbi:MAG: S8 family serine peptidase [Bdellovibrio sp.]|nr:S8 family serine peptidase [Bdellovibrio sp.]
MNLKGRVFCSALFSILAMATVAQAKEVESVPGEYIVRLKPNMMMTQSTQQLSKALGAYIKSTIPSQNIVVVKRAAIETTKSAVKSLAANDMVDVVEPNFIYKINRTPNDPMYGQLWGMLNVGQADSTGALGVAGVDINVEKAWDIETGSKKILVAVIDTGVDFNHPDLKDNLWTNEVEANGKAGVDDDANGVIDDIHGFNAITGTGNAMDDQGHGSHCSGTIGAKGNDGKGIVGVNWDTQIMAVKFLDANGSGSLENALKAIDYATKMGAKVMSNSWGGGGFSQTLMDAIKRSNDAGAIFIAAAGNDGSNNDTTPSYPASYDVANIISVAAIDNKGQLASFSNYGKKSVHLGAPGVNIYSSTGGAYDSWSGTSMATPHVSGVAALAWAHEPELTAVQLKERLVSTTRPLAGLRGKVKSGGLLNAYNALANVVAPPDQNDPVNWATKNISVASESPYLKNTNQTYNVTVKGAKEFAVYFEKFDTEGTYDTVQIIDSTGKVVQTLSGTNDDVFSASVMGDTMKIVFKSDASVEKTGWKITKAAFR